MQTVLVGGFSDPQTVSGFNASGRLQNTLLSYDHFSLFYMVS